MKIEGLHGLSKLRELYISHNGIEKLEGLEDNVSSMIICLVTDLVFLLDLDDIDT